MMELIEALAALYASVHLAMALALFAGIWVDGHDLYDDDHPLHENLCGWLTVLALAPLFFCIVWHEEF
jgi:hypothetical protein